jgi:phage shock protein PspC (stress-responsive transcriptional regulator)
MTTKFVLVFLVIERLRFDLSVNLVFIMFTLVIVFNVSCAFIITFLIHNRIIFSAEPLRKETISEKWH